MANNSRDLSRIIAGILQFGLAGFKLKNNGTTAQIRNSADNGWEDLECQDVLIHSSNGTFKVTLVAPTLTGDITVTLPLVTTTIAPFGANYSKVFAFNQATASPFTIDAAPPVNGYVRRTRVQVLTAAAGGSPTLQIGVSGTLGREMTTIENSLKEVGGFTVENFTSLGASPAAIIGTLVASAQTFTGLVVMDYIAA